MDGRDRTIYHFLGQKITRSSSAIYPLDNYVRSIELNRYIYVRVSQCQVK